MEGFNTWALASPVPGSILDFDPQPGLLFLAAALLVSCVCIGAGVWRRGRVSTARTATRMRLVRQPS